MLAAMPVVEGIELADHLVRVSWLPAHAALDSLHVFAA